MSVSCHTLYGILSTVGKVTHQMRRRVKSMESSYSVDYSAQSSPLVNVIALLLVVLIIVAIWKIFEKAGEPGWKAIIPLYNVYTEYKIFWGNGWLCLLTLIPIVNIVVTIILYSKISKAFGHGAGFTVGLLFLPYVFLTMLGFNGDEYQGPQ